MSEPVETGFRYIPFADRPGGSNRPKPAVVEEPEDENVPHHCGDGVGLAKMTMKQLNAWHDELRIALPKLTFNDIRRHKLPLYVSICFELEEEGLPQSAANINELIQYNSDMRDAAGPDTIIWLRPKLMDNRAFLERLREGLTKAEKSRMAGNFREECRSYLKLAVFFMNEKNCWWWVAEQLFIKSVDCILNSDDDLKKIETITRYIYGMFLLRQLNDVDGSLVQLKIALALSEGTSLNATRELMRPQLTVYIETCRHLYKALLLSAIQLRSYDPKQSVRLCKEAYKRATDAIMPEAKAEALFEKGLSYQEDGQPIRALKSFFEYLQLCKTLKNSNWICNAYLEIAFCHKNMDDAEQTMSYLKKFQWYAESENLSMRLAEAHRYLGEFLLNLGDTEQARANFAVAFSLYYRMGPAAEIEEVRALSCIAEGLDLLPLYAQLVKDSDVNGPATVRLLRWKDLRTSFWGDAGCVSEMSVSEESVEEADLTFETFAPVAGESGETTSESNFATSAPDDDALNALTEEVELSQIQPEESDEF